VERTQGQTDGPRCCLMPPRGGHNTDYVKWLRSVYVTVSLRLVRNFVLVIIFTLHDSFVTEEEG